MENPQPPSALPATQNFDGLIVVTDLDGTLLDHHDYSYAAAQTALARLQAENIPLILATSKTRAEVAPLHAALGLGDWPANWPAIIENGAGIYDPVDGAAGEGQAYLDIRNALDQLEPRLRVCFRGFGDMSAQEIAAATGLSPQAAQDAKQREYSEPGLWQGEDDAQAAFEDALAAQGVFARYGGRFLTLSTGQTKANAMAEVKAKLGATTVIALGDAPNDVEMIAAANVGVIIKNTHGTPLAPLSERPNQWILRSDALGPSGWNACVHEILDHIAHSPLSERKFDV